MKGMDNNKELNENRLMEVTVGIAETANKEKNSEVDPNTDFKIFTCRRCKKSLNFRFSPIEKIILLQRLDFGLNTQNLLKNLKKVKIICVRNVLKDYTHQDTGDNYDYEIIKDKSILQTN